eukprot:25231-Pelagococcus_subviridis.AAC.1
MGTSVGTGQNAPYPALPPARSTPDPPNTAARSRTSARGRGAAARSRGTIGGAISPPRQWS